MSHRGFFGPQKEIKIDFFTFSYVGCIVPSWRGDNYCDDGNNNEGCDYDGGDCCGSNVNKTYCQNCECLDPNNGGE